jgi:hypothetical protein
MKLVLWILAIFLLAAAPLSAQNQAAIAEEDQAFLELMEDSLALLAYAVVNDSLAEYRFGACREMIPRLVRALKVQNAFHYPFERLQSVSIQYPPDSSFRIFSWQLYVDKDDYRYYGAIQMNSPDLKLYPLIDRSFNLQGDLEQMILKPDNWYGAVYYHIHGFIAADGKPAYLLFGFDGYSFFRKRKIIDVLSFSSGEPLFGAPVFAHADGTTKNRILRQYAAEASTRCNYDPDLNLVIFDHLIELSGTYGEGPNYYPDGSYEGYKLQKGSWIHVDKVFNQISDEPPMPAPILKDRPKDIFGKQ